MLLAALEHVAHAEVVVELFHADVLALVGEGGAAGDDEALGQPREAGGQLLGDDVGEIILPRLAAEAGEGQHHDRQRRRRGCRARPAAVALDHERRGDRHHREQQDAQREKPPAPRRRPPGGRRARRLGERRQGRGAECPDMHGSADVLHCLLALVGKREGQLVAHMLVDRAGDGEPAGLGQRLEPRRDVDAVAVDVAALDDDVAEIEADAEVEPAVARDLGIACRHGALNLRGAGHGGDRARELGENAVAGGLDYAAVMGGDLGLQHLAVMLGERAQRADLVRAHEPAVAGHVGGEDSRKPSFDALLAHEPLPSASGG